MTLFNIDVSTCVGCAPRYSYQYKVIQTSPDIEFLGKTELGTGTRPRVLGGTKTIRFSFVQQEDTQDSGTSEVILERSNYGVEKPVHLVYDITNGHPILNKTQIT